MKKVWYIGFYDGDKCSQRRRSEGNMAGTVYMNGLISSLRSLHYHVSLVSLQHASKPGIYGEEHIVIDEGYDQYFLPYITIKVGSRMVGGRTAVYALERFVKKNVGRDDIVISYHSLAYRDVLTRLHRAMGFTWIPEVNEIYCLSRQSYADASLLPAEVKLFEEGDAFLFAGDALARQYAKDKPFVVLYGNYDAVVTEKAVAGDAVNITYTGIVNEDRGVFRIVEAMSFLPCNYYLYILGFGTEAELEKLKTAIRSVNEKLGQDRVFYCGTRVGREYSDFLADKHIGVSLMSQQEDVSNNAFPGKILSYMSHSLFVLSSACDSMQNSRLGEHMYFCDNTPESIAAAIREIPVTEGCSLGQVLVQLKEEFEKELAAMLSAF